MSNIPHVYNKQRCRRHHIPVFVMTKKPGDTTANKNIFYRYTAQALHLSYVNIHNIGVFDCVRLASF